MTGGVGFIFFNVIGRVAMEPEEYKGYMITEAPGGMFKATEIEPYSQFKPPLNACTIESLKISINYEIIRTKRVRKKRVRKKTS